MPSTTPRAPRWAPSQAGSPGRATAAYAGVAAAETAGMASDGAEVRFWAYADTANQNRVFTDGGASEVRLNTSGQVLIYTKRTAAGYTANAYTVVGTYAVGWMEYRLVYDFSRRHLHAVVAHRRQAARGRPSRPQARRPPTSPCARRTDRTATGSVLFRAYQNANWWLDDVAYSDSGISEEPPAPDTTPPAAPTGLLATAGTGQVSLSWAANAEPDLAGYFLYRNGALVNARADDRHLLHRPRPFLRHLLL